MHASTVFRRAGSAAVNECGFVVIFPVKADGGNFVLPAIPVVIDIDQLPGIFGPELITVIHRK